jgi:isopropylmalate/homocitrate/citramalate synthase
MLEAKGLQGGSQSLDVKVVDSTLREGEQAPGVAFTVEEALKIVEFDLDVGIDLIEVFTPYSEYELELVNALRREGLSSKLVVWSRLRREDFELALKTEASWIAVSFGISDIHLKYKFNGLRREEALMKVFEAIDYLHSHGVKVSMHLEDSTRADLNYMVEFLKNVNAEKFRDCDTLSVLLPPLAFERMRFLVKATDKPIETHYHNDLGMAVGNTISAVLAGASWISATWNGLGERAGNAPMEEVLLTLKTRLNVDRFNVKPLRTICRFIAEVSGSPISRNKPVAGLDIFTVESGIHQDGLLKDRRVYEPYPPEILGESWRIVIGDSSGRSGLVHVLNHEMGYDVPEDPDKLTELLMYARAMARMRKRYLSLEDLEELVEKFSLKKKI